MPKCLLFTAGFFFILTILSCGEKFDKTKWDGDDPIGGSDKVSMAEDLIKTKKLIGLTNKQMLQLVGQPANDTTATW
ncbi:MAG: hypothetical protein M3N14_02990, partial [Bacteroidota bacterium]|nr:hypothetical protein [Bacteroidota bacterium]